MFIQLSPKAAIASFVSLLFASPSLAEPLLTRFPNIEPASLHNNPPICFAQISTNQALDLSSICGFRSPNICNVELGETAEKTRLLSDFCKKNQRCEQTGTCNQQPAGLPDANSDFQG
ncbi:MULTISPECIES: hypothetical protein [Pseudanabaena]|uniref:hypothetical protein n=1 Tax=Pseudanabaena TaxID=1152 RepID=UPI00247A7224|nr:MULTISPECIES: hypothetical protein [Pseudanabaena]MEA5489647.1 hypothetical protein [Pseudanabaena sp. CCNP1317]WGS75252.1 hypothetical protein OA858_25810 [Pseudanabaena galeata CCNP1313]